MTEAGCWANRSSHNGRYSIIADLERREALALVSEPDKVRKQRRRFLRAVYDLAQGCPTTLVRKADVAQRLGLDVRQQAGFDEFMVIAQYFSDLGYIRTFEGATKEYREYGMLEITGQGIKAVEENL